MSVATAISILWLLDPLLGEHFALLTLYGGVALAVWLGGWKPAGLAAILGYAAVNYWFIPPRNQFVLDLVALVRMAIYAISCGAVIGIGELMHRARQSAEREAAERMRIAEALRVREQQLQLALEVSHTVAWSWDLRTDEVAQSENSAQIFGTRTKHRKMWDTVHPDDVTGLRSRADRAMAECGEYEAEVRILRPDDGTTIWAYFRGRVECDSSRQPLRIVGTATDITERKRTQDALQKAEQIALADLQAMSRLRDIGTLCTRPGSRREGCLDAILQAAIAFTGAQKGNIQLLDDAGALKIAVQHGFDDPFLNFFANGRCEASSACGAAMQSDQRVVVEDVERSEIFIGQPSLAVLLEAGVRAVQSTPLTTTSANVVGMISTHFAQPHRLGERELHLMDLLALQTADFMERRHAQVRLREQRELIDRQFAELSAVYQHAPIGLAFLDGQLRFVRINENLAAWSGVPIADHLGRTLREVLPGKLADEIEPLHRQVLTTGEVVSDFEMTGETSSQPGVLRAWNVNCIPIRDGAGEIVGVNVVAQEITERKRAMDRLRQNEERYRATFDNAAVGIAHVALDGRWLRLNDAVSKITGKSKEELLAKTFGEITHPDDLQNFSQQARRILAAEIATNMMEQRLLRKDGAWIWICLTISVLRDATGAPRHFIFIIEDIDARKRMEAALRITQQHLELVSNTVPALMFYIGLDRRYRTCNDAFTAWFGVRREEVVGKHVREFVGEEAWSAIQPHLDAAYAGVTVDYETEAPYRLGGTRYIHAIYTPDRDADGETLGIVVQVMDISEAKRAEKALRESEALLAAVLKQLPVGLGVIDTNGKWIVKNRLIENFVSTAIPSTPPARIDRWRAFDAGGIRVPPENWPGARALRGETVSPGMEMIFTDDDGKEHWMRASAAPLLDAGQVIGAMTIVQDIDELKRAELHLAQFAAIVLSAGHGIVSESLDGIVASWNPGAELLFGYAPNEMIGRSIRRIIPTECASAEDVLTVKLRAGESSHLETVRLNHRGDRVHVSISSSPIKDASGKVIGISKIARDITLQKEAEEKLNDAQRKLSLHAASLEITVIERTAQLQETVNDLQHFSYSIAHDMRAPLRAMGTFAQLLMEEIAASGFSPLTKTYIDRIILGAARLDNLIKDALNYTKAVLQEVPLRAVDLSTLVQGVVDTYPNLHSESANIRIEALPVVLGNESLLTQCVSNLLGNAVKFVPTGQRPKIRVYSELKNGFVRVSVEDNGIGIPTQAQPRLFAMFQKLNTQYEGTGMGLAIVRKAIERMGGKVGVDSEPDRGSRFWMELLATPTKENA